MKKVLLLTSKAPRPIATWVPTGDARRPLACIWVISDEKNPKSQPGTEPEADRWHACA